MKKRQLGVSDLYVSELGFGTMSLPNDEQQATDILHTAFEAGINFFDTADLYAAGKNEQLLAPFLKEHRQDIVLATKVGNEMNSDGQTWSWNPSKDYIIEAVKKSCQRLGTDYIDLYQLHGGTMEDEVGETIEAFEQLKREGIILQYGISSIRPNVIDRFLENSAAVSVMMQYSALDRRPEEWFPMIEKHGASVITRGTIAKGLLTGDGTSSSKVAQGFAAYGEEDLRATLIELEETFDQLYSTSIHFNLQNPVVATALIGASTKEQLMDSIIAYERSTSIDDFLQLQKLTKKHQYEAHRP